MFIKAYVLYIIFTCCTCVIIVPRKFDDKELLKQRQKVLKMFYHAYDSYWKYAYPYDELRPLTCDGHDTWGSYSLTLIDALDTLAIIGNYSEFRRVVKLLISNINFDKDINVSVFETNIRVVGGLLSAHLFSKKAEMETEDGWPCSGPLLRLAENVARRLLPAFETATGMPYGTVNLRFGVPKDETTITCTACVGTFILEFGVLSKLTGDLIYENVALKALYALYEHRSELGLFGNHINIQTGKWTALDAGIGAGIDSFYEYLVKGSYLFNKVDLMDIFQELKISIDKYLKHDDWYFWVNMKKGHVTLPVFQSLEAFWPGLLALTGDVENSLKTLHNYMQVWNQYGLVPEFYNIPKSEAYSNKEGYPLRPELIESLMYLYKATNDQMLLEYGVSILTSIEIITRTSCGYATVKNAGTHLLDNRMESFFLAETTKYLYLLFTPDHWINNSEGTVIQSTAGECIIDTGGYIFNTEAHPFDAASVYCCSPEKQYTDNILQQFKDKIDLSIFLGYVNPNDKFFKPLDDILFNSVNDQDDDINSFWHIPEHFEELYKHDHSSKINEVHLSVLREIANAKNDSLHCDAVEVNLHNYFRKNSKSKINKTLSCPSPTFLEGLSVGGESFD